MITRMIAAALVLALSAPVAASAAPPTPATITATDTTYGSPTVLTFTGEAAVVLECWNEVGHLMWRSDILTPLVSPVAVFTSGWPTDPGTVAACTATLLGGPKLRKALAVTTYTVIS